MISQSTRNFIKNFQTIKQEKKRRTLAANGEEKAKTADNSKASLESSFSESMSIGGSHFPVASSLFQVSQRRAAAAAACPRIPRKPVIRSPVLLKTMSAHFGDDHQLRGAELKELSENTNGVMLQGKVMKAEVPVFKEKIRVQRKVQSLPSID